MLPTVICIDDDPAVLRTISRVLSLGGAEWTIQLFQDSTQAWQYLSDNPVDAVICDVTMPALDGLEILRRMSGQENTRHIPVTMLTGMGDLELKQKALDLGAIDLLSKPFQPSELLARLRNMLRLKKAEDELRNRNRDLDAIVRRRTRQLQVSRLQIILRLAKAGEFRDEDTGDHVVRVASYSRILARQMGLPEASCEQLFLAAPLHDIGKIGIPDSILLKPGRLTPDERRIIQTHCEIGERILREPSLTELCMPKETDLFAPSEVESDPLMEAARQIALSHHERWDGKGYPHGLAGEAIPLLARIVSVCDVFDALTSARPYKSALSFDESVQIILNGCGTQFDPQVVQAFERSLEELIAVKRLVACAQERLLQENGHAVSDSPLFTNSSDLESALFSPDIMQYLGRHEVVAATSTQ